jgi:peptide/nickel transport system ATP-binding protein
MLLSAVPEIDGENAISPAVRSDPGVASARPESACPFTDRCPWKLGPICHDVEPPWQTTGNGHALRCHIPLEELSRKAAASQVRVGSLSPDNAPTEEPGA